MSITPRKLKSGKTVYDIAVYTGKRSNGTYERVYETVHSLTLARRIEAELTAQYKALNAHSGKITLSAYIDNVYWPSAVSRLSATSLDTYQREISIRIKPGLGSCKLHDIDRVKIQAMVDEIPTAKTARKTIGVLKTILNEALADGFIAKNPACAKFAYPADAGKQRDNGLVLSTFEEIADMLYIVRKGSQCVQRIAYTGLLQGLRPEERYALDWSCFDVSLRTITISEARVMASRRFGGVQNKPTKTPLSNRVIPMHPDFYTWLCELPRGKGAFILGENGQISPSTAQKRWRDFLAAHPECPSITIENMRHSFATAYLAAGGQIEVLSRLLGHANIHTTINRYYRPDFGVLANDLLRVAEKSRMRCIVPGSLSEFDSPRLHHSE